MFFQELLNPRLRLLRRAGLAGHVGEYSGAVTVLKSTGGIKPHQFVWQIANGTTRILPVLAA